MEETRPSTSGQSIFEPVANTCWVDCSPSSRAEPASGMARNVSDVSELCDITSLDVHEHDFCMSNDNSAILPSLRESSYYTTQIESLLLAERHDDYTKSWHPFSAEPGPFVHATNLTPDSSRMYGATQIGSCSIADDTVSSVLSSQGQQISSASSLPSWTSSTLSNDSWYGDSSPYPTPVPSFGTSSTISTQPGRSPMTPPPPIARLRTKSKKYYCKVCDRPYLWFSSLRSHARQKHGFEAMEKPSNYLKDRTLEKLAECKQRTPDGATKLVPPDTCTGSSLPFSVKVSSLFVDTASGSLSQEALLERRQQSQNSFGNLCFAPGDHVLHHLIDLVNGLRKQDGHCFVGTHETTIECEISYDSAVLPVQASKLYEKLELLLGTIRLFANTLPFQLTLCLKRGPATKIHNLTPGLEPNEAGSASRSTSLYAGIHIGSVLHIKGQRYPVAEIACDDLNYSFNSNAATLSRIEDVLLRASKSNERALGEEGERDRKTSDIKKRKCGNDKWLCYGADWSHTEEEEDERDEEDDELDEDNEDEAGGERQSFLPYFFSPKAYAISPTDSMESGSSSNTNGNQDTPASSLSSQSDGSNLNNHQPAHNEGSGIGSSDNQSNPLVGNKNRISPAVCNAQPRPLICWYPAAGTPCSAKHAKRSTETRYLFGDHVWGKANGLNHRLPPACTVCHRVFATKALAEAHSQAIRDGSICVAPTKQALEEINHGPSCLGITEEKKDAINKIRIKIKYGEVPRDYDHAILDLIHQRVEDNISLYINGSDTTENAARTELWKWYIIFKELRPDDEIPLNPFTSKCLTTGTENSLQANAVRIYNTNIDQLCSNNNLPLFSDAHRQALNQAFLNTLEMLGAEEDQERSRSAQRLPRTARKRQKRSPPDVEQPIEPTPAPAQDVPSETPEEGHTQDVENHATNLPQLETQMLPTETDISQPTQASTPPLSPVVDFNMPSPIEHGEFSQFVLEFQEQQEQEYFAPMFPSVSLSDLVGYNDVPP